MKFVDDIESSWNWFSIQAMTFAATLQAVWINLPSDMKSALPQNFIQWATVILLVLGIIGRLVKQGEK